MKPSHLLFAGLTALSLTACGATTGGAAQTLVQQKSHQEVATLAAPTTKVETQTLDASIDAYDNMDCATLEAKIAEEEAIMDEARANIIEKSTMSEEVGKMALNQGASRALKSVPFGGLLAKTAIKSVGSSKEQKIEQAKTDFNEANLRKANLSGLYAGKNCGS